MIADMLQISSRATIRLMISQTYFPEVRTDAWVRQNCYDLGETVMNGWIMIRAMPGFLYTYHVYSVNNLQAD